MRRLLVLSTSLALAAVLIAPASAAAFSTNGKCFGLMVQTGTIELVPGFWAEGMHTFSVRYVDPMYAIDDIAPPVMFTVSSEAPLYAGQVRVDMDGLFQGYLDVPDQTINPAQDTVLWAAWFFDMTGELFGGPPMTMQEVHADAAQAWIAFSVDGGDWLAARMSPYRSVCANGMLTDTNDTPLYHRTWGPSR